jgi:lantibiotic modifying enzyme
MRRRDFLKLTAAGSTLLGATGWVPAATGRLGPRLRDPLQVAEAAAAWIRANGREVGGGLCWPAVPGDDGRVALNLYSGTPGVVLFLLELHHATGNPVYLQEARSAALTIRRAYLEPGPWLEELGTGEGDPSLRDHGLYTGRAGAAFAVAEAFRVGRTGTLPPEAEELFLDLVTAARPDGDGVIWHLGDPESAVYDVIGGSAGIGLTLLYAHERFQLPGALDTAAGAGRHLVRKARQGRGGLKWPMTETYARLMPNFSHGTAGVSYFLARLAEVSGDQGFLDPAVEGARYLQEIARCRADGCLMYHHEPAGEDLYYLGWCHGPTGTARLFRQLALVTGEDEWHQWVLKGAKGIRDQGIPEERTEGFWNNVSQCCGDAGVGDFFLSLSGATGNEGHAAFARRLGDYVLAEASQDQKGASWSQAEHRTRPEFLQAQTGWMQGAAGVGAFFLHLDGAAKGRPSRVRFPDSPWT